MRILIVGLGSMGKRRIRLLQQINAAIDIIGIDVRTDRQIAVHNENIKTVASLSDGMSKKPNCAFVCTPPLLHANIILQLIKNNIHVFSELNLVSDGYEKLLLSAKEHKISLFLSNTMLYRKEIRYICDKLRNAETSLSYLYHVGQYLPDWHPWEDYKDFFVNIKRSNACREIFSIELPWIIKAFGAIKNMRVQSEKISNLGIDYNDRYFVFLEHESGHKGNILVDTVSPIATRKFEVFGEHLHILWDGTPSSLQIFDPETKKPKFIDLYANFQQDANYASNIIETAYKDEIINFFDVIEKKAVPLYSFEEDFYTLSVIDEIEARE